MPRPALTFHNLIDRSPAQRKLPHNFQHIAFLFISKTFSYLNCLSFRKFYHPMRFSLSLPVLVFLVLHVFFLRPNEEMGKPNARSVITSVKHIESLPYFPVLRYPGKAICLDPSARILKTELSVSINEMSDPCPARAKLWIMLGNGSVFIYSRPEAVYDARIKYRQCDLLSRSLKLRAAFALERERSLMES